jgi:MFS family permease
LIILFAAVMFSATKLIMWSQQPYFMAIGLDESLFGVLMAVGFLLAGSSSHLAHKLDGKVGNLQVLAAVWLVALVVCLVTGLHQGPVGVAFLMVGGSCLFGLANPRVSEAINRRVDSSRRATVLSTQGLMISLFFVPTSLVVGAVNDHHGIAGSLLAIAGWLAVAGVLLSLLLVNKDRRRRLLML